MTTRSAASHGRFFRLNLWLHRWTSLIATPFFLVLCVTGTVLVFHEELDRALGYVPTLERSEVRKPLAELVAAAQRTAPDQKPMSVFIDAQHPEVAYVSLAPLAASRLEDGKPQLIGTATAEPLGAVDFDATPTGFLFKLHADWFLGPPGQLFGGVIALLVLISLLSGLVVHAPYVKRLVFGVVRGGQGPGARLRQLDLHNLVGLVVLGWALAVTITGIALALGLVATRAWQATELRAMAAKTPVDLHAPPLDPRALPTTIDAAVRTAQAALPDQKPYFMVWPGTDYSSPRHYTILMSGTHRYDERQFQVVLVDAASGQLTDARDVPWYLKAILISEPLHFGDYGGLPLKLLWVASSLLTLFITGNGAWLWWRRRGRRSAPPATAAGRPA